jgi:UDP-N-acetylmuramoyl-tripeptide--D-alanyl-D-alanine ligase
VRLRFSEIERMLAATLAVAQGTTGDRPEEARRAEKRPLETWPVEGQSLKERSLEERFATGYSIDSRTVAAGDLFFAIRGPQHDGHDYIDAALQRGAAGAVAARDWLAARLAGGGGVERVIGVDDPAEALRGLAAAARLRWGRPVVGITGSNGKTTTKEAVSALLATRYRVSKTEGNLNNEFGLPLSLLRIDDEAEIGVLEMGMNHRGEIRRLAGIARPTVGVVTNVNAAHLEYFESVDEIALAKQELIESLGPEGVAVLNAGDERVRRFAETHPGRTRTFGVQTEADFQAVQLESLGPQGVRFVLQWEAGDGGSRETGFVSPLPGRHNVANVAAAMAVAGVFEIEPPELVEAVAGLKAFRMRGEFIKTGGVKVLNDCYNANPAAVMAMLEVLRQTPARRRVAVLGEMRELGEASPALHRQVGEAAAEAADVLVAVQGNAREIAAGADASGLSASAAHFFEDAVAAGDFLAEFLADGDAVLFKASRAVGLERAVERVLR